MTELFLYLSLLTGLEVVPLQNAATGLVCSVTSPVLLYLARRAWAACRRQPRPLSDVAAEVLRRLTKGGNWTRHAEHVEVSDDTVYVCAERYKDGKALHTPQILVEGASVLPHLGRGEAALIYAAARVLFAELVAEEKEAARLEALEKLQSEQEAADAEDEDDDDDDTDVLKAPGLKAPQPGPRAVRCDCPSYQIERMLGVPGAIPMPTNALMTPW